MDRISHSSMFACARRRNAGVGVSESRRTVGSGWTFSSAFICPRELRAASVIINFTASKGDPNHLLRQLRPLGPGIHEKTASHLRRVYPGGGSPSAESFPGRIGNIKLTLMCRWCV